MDLSFFESKVVEDRLGSYVYLLVDPRIGEPFYVGKAGGKHGRGNMRPDAHLRGAADALRNSRHLTTKDQRIADIWAAGFGKPELVIARRQIPTEAAALEVEASMIEVLKHLSLGATCNAVLGHFSERGLLAGDELKILDAPAVDPTCAIAPVWLFNISKIYPHKRPDLFEAVRGNWNIAKPSAPAIAVGLIGGVSRVVCQVDRWRDTEEFVRNRPRQAFDGAALDPAHRTARELLHRDFARILKACLAWNYGSPLCLAFDGAGGAKPLYKGDRNAVIRLSH